MEEKKKRLCGVLGVGGEWGGLNLFPFYFIHQSAYGDVFRVNPGNQELRVDMIFLPKKTIPTRMDEPQLGGSLLRVDMLNFFPTPYNKPKKVLSIIIMCGLFRFVYSKKKISSYCEISNSVSKVSEYISGYDVCSICF
jgi:hypothetical protein